MWWEIASVYAGMSAERQWLCLACLCAGRLACKFSAAPGKRIVCEQRVKRALSSCLWGVRNGRCRALSLRECYAEVRALADVVMLRGRLVPRALFEAQ